jgi:thioesterase domain-containing protein/acyl carrier protein
MKEKISIIQATPATYKMLIDAGWKDRLDLKILSGGETLSKTLADKLLTRGKLLYNLYGPTETTIHSMIAEISLTDEIISVGYPIRNTRIYILDDYGNLLPEGMKGEIFVAGEGVSRGYLNQEELQSEKFIHDPFSEFPGKKMYKTGDYGKLLPDRRIQHLGRIDYQIKIHGYRIEPGEIEYVLNALPSIKESLVTLREDGIDGLKLIAFLVVKEKNNDQELAELCRKSLANVLPPYMVPYEFVVVESFLLTPNGKIDRDALTHLRRVNNSVAEKELLSETERKIASIWSSILGIQNIGLNQNFFSLGGHSLIAAQVMIELEKSTGHRFPLTALFEAPTIKALSQLLDSKVKENSWKSLIPIKPEGSSPPLYIVHGSGLTVLIFHSLAINMAPEQPVFGLQARGLNGIDEPFDNMEDIASYYISEILEQNPKGPYNLAGYSFGGIVAFEMAKQLEAKQKKINFLGIFDTYVDHSSYLNEWLLRIEKKFKRQYPKYRFILSSFIKKPRTTLYYQFYAFSGRVKRFFTMIGMSKILIKESERLKHSKKVNRKHDIAFEKYKLKPYNGTIDLFRVRDKMYYQDDPTYLGWKSFALGGLNIHEVPGDHGNLFNSPHVEELAKILSRVIGERNRETE